jgi:hypothetical protein
VGNTYVVEECCRRRFGGTAAALSSATVPRTVVPSAAGAADLTTGRCNARFVAAGSSVKMANCSRGHRPSRPSRLFRPAARPSVRCSHVMHVHPLSVAVPSRAWSTARSVPSDTV